MTTSEEAKAAIRKLTRAQRALFDQLCSGELTQRHPRTMEALVATGLVEARKTTLTGRPPMTVTEYKVPTFVHIAWAEICSERRRY